MKRDTAIKEIKDEDFNGEVLKCKLPVLACFTAEWCRSCYPTCLIADELAKRYEGSVKFVKINVDRSPEVSTRFRITTMPTILVFSNSQLLEKRIGFQERGVLKRLLDNVTSLPEDKLGSS
ncbi:MAG: thiol reductase thioredoxin [Dehalococcoidia bacterium]|nr:thiol reductase thioredoxin [Dehalococcoidia bacterium]